MEEGNTLFWWFFTKKNSYNNSLMKNITCEIAVKCVFSLKIHKNNPSFVQYDSNFQIVIARQHFLSPKNFHKILRAICGKTSS